MRVRIAPGPRAALPAAFLSLVVASLALAFPAAGHPQTPRLLSVATFTNPVYIDGAPGDYDRLFVVEQGGRIQVFRDGTQLAVPFLDISADVLHSGEQGLLSMAFAPDYQSSGRFYVYYTDRAGNNRLEEFRRSAASPDRADPATRRLLLTFAHPVNPNHNGGQLQFGPDSLLYIATGDGGGSGDPANNAQNLGSLLGKILRIDPLPSGASEYQVPSDNPFVGTQGARGEVYSYGLRNPWRFAFDRQTGDIAIGDVGQSAVEEVDFALQGQARGVNYGWDAFEGTRPYEPKPITGHVPPVIEHYRTEGWRSVVGGYVARHPSLGSLRGRYVYGDFYLGRIYSAILEAGGAREDGDTGLAVPSMASFGEDTAGCLYVASLPGQVYRLAVPSETAPGPCPAPPGQPGGGAGGGGPGGAAGGADTRAPRLSLRAARRQRVLRRRAVTFSARCDEACALTASGRARIAGTRRALRLRSVTRALPADRRTAVRVRLSRSLLARVRRAVRRQRRATVLLTVSGRDRAGNRASARLRIALVG